MLPLEGITVVSLEQAVAAPFATRQLADLGARVIKVERPEGDFARKYDSKVKGMSSIFTWLNRSKESIVLDLKKEEGKEALSRLLEKADVFIHNLAPGAVDRLGFGQEMLKENHPKLISCSISGYGKDGPYKDKKAYDMLIQGEAGLMSITGTQDTPSRAGISIADIAAGMYAYTGVLTALIQRSKTNTGATLEVSMLEALSEWMSYPLLYTAYGETELQRTGSSHAGIYPYGIFKLVNGQAVFLAIQNEREWNRFCENVVADERMKTDSRFATNSDRVANNTELRKLIENKFNSIGFVGVMDRLNKSGIANGEMKNIQSVLEHPQLHHRKRWKDTETPVGVIKTLIPPVTSEEISYKMSPVPRLGEHTESILNELGLSMEKLKI